MTKGKIFLLASLLVVGTQMYGAETINNAKTISEKDESTTFYTTEGVYSEGKFNLAGKTLNFIPNIPSIDNTGGVLKKIEIGEGKKVVFNTPDTTGISSFLLDSGENGRNYILGKGTVLIEKEFQKFYLVHINGNSKIDIQSDIILSSKSGDNMISVGKDGSVVFESLKLTSKERNIKGISFVGSKGNITVKKIDVSVPKSITGLEAYGIRTEGNAENVVIQGGRIVAPVLFVSEGNGMGKLTLGSDSSRIELIGAIQNVNSGVNIDVNLTNKDSTANISEFNNEGKINLTVANGGTLTLNKAGTKTGDLVLKGGVSAANKGNIVMGLTDETKAIEISDYSGYTTVMYSHTDDGTKTENYKGSPLKIKTISSAGEMTLSTPSNDILLSNEGKIKAALNSLAGKLSLASGAATSSFKGKVQIEIPEG